MTKRTLEDVRKQMTGTGVYLMENITNADLMLPKQSLDGWAIVGPGKRFKGDSYLLKTMRGQVRLIEDLSIKEKLITEQPPTVTKDGLVETEIKDDKNESTEKGDVLLLEHPLDHVTLLD